MFLVTEPLQLLDIYVFLLMNFSLLFMYPLFLFKLKNYFYNVWYKYQIKFFNKIIISFCLCFFLLQTLLQISVINNLVIFLFNWYILKKESLFTIKLELILFKFLEEISGLRYLFTFYVTSIIYTYLLIKNNLCFNFIYFKLKQHKKTFYFFIKILFSFLITTGDVPTLLSALITVLFLTESFYFISCIKFSLINKNIKDAYI
uniref:Preprotein translocase subunit SecY n=1 Tax=Neogoniolithon spectabile TaxID=231755 RepID=A0A3G3MIJ5_9FLOR|nr:preprotein translocase subunit SecY [Neogoniolithon spectabile]AYR06662.1 preprotein translocase subunit SecY [Neogoniolithon spectabile]